ncbi:MAG TPA: carboxypeptidase-like regulatory domain-containing protein [Bryobacteraceae bacterium]|nr:carboxypeptidase-like regulatory domain-containing protein [Bryobacteraceae bacterium]
MQLTLKHLLLLAAASTLAFAQEFRASLSGRITDSSGASVAGANIAAISVATNVAAPAVSNGEGYYQILFLNPGEYVVTVEKQGFQKTVQKNLVLQVSEKGSLDVQLSVGDVVQTMTVEANAGIVEAESAERGLTVDSRRVEATPLQGRNVIAMAWTAPGVAVTATVQRLRPFDIGGSTGMSINGGRPKMNEVLVDGVTALDRGQNVTFIPQSETTDEMRVQTTAYDAQYGWTTGGLVNITTKSGANMFHGTLFEYFQNTVLNANTFNSNRNGIPRQASNINTFGGSLGGAVIPNKLFFYFGHEQIRQVIPDPFVTSVPTALQRNGDFSQTYYAANAAGERLLQTIYDPFSTRTVNGAIVRDPFPGNQIVRARINPVAGNVLALIPQGNVPGDPLTGLNNFTNVANTRKFSDIYPEWSGRGDYVFSEMTRMFVRYSRNALQESRGYRYSTTDAYNIADTSTNSLFTRDNHNAVVQFTRTLNASTVLDVRGGLSRFQSLRGYPTASNFDVSSLGFSSLFKSHATPYFPRFTFANYEGAGTAPINKDPISQTTSAQAAIYKSIGRHSLKTGGEWRLMRYNAQIQGNSAGSFNFTQQFTGANALAVAAGSGNAIASFLMGTPASGVLDVQTQPARQQHLLSGFVHDEFRVSQKLKLNLGLRWDLRGPITDRFNAMLAGFNANTPAAIQAPGLDLRGGLVYAGVNGVSRGVGGTDWNNLAPRFGAAYQWNAKTIFRGGYALMYAQTFDDPGTTPGYNRSTPMVVSVASGVPENTLTNPFPGGILQPVGSSQGLATNLGQGISFAAAERTLPYTQQFSFELQRELPFRLLLSAGYVGSRIDGLPVSRSLNYLSLADMALGANFLAQSVPNPMAGLLPGTSYNNATIVRSQLLLPYPHFAGITESQRPEGSARYDAFQFMLSKRMSNGLSAGVSYTYSRTLERTAYRNAQDTELEKIVSAWDVPQSLQLNAVYELPFGKGRQFLSGGPGFLRGFVSGWNVSGIARIQSGWPITLGGNTVPTGVTPVATNQSLDRWFNTCTVSASGVRTRCASPDEPAAWTVRPANTLQTWSSYMTSVREPGLFNLDLALMKQTQIKERLSLTFRAEAMNATNTPQWQNRVNTDVNSGNFGAIVGTNDQRNLPRFFQLSLKLAF